MGSNTGDPDCSPALWPLGHNRLHLSSCLSWGGIITAVPSGSALDSPTAFVNCRDTPWCGRFLKGPQFAISSYSCSIFFQNFRIPETREVQSDIIGSNLALNFRWWRAEWRSAMTFKGDGGRPHWLFNFGCVHNSAFLENLMNYRLFKRICGLYVIFPVHRNGIPICFLVTTATIQNKMYRIALLLITR